MDVFAFDLKPKFKPKPKPKLEKHNKQSGFLNNVLTLNRLK